MTWIYFLLIVIIDFALCYIKIIYGIIVEYLLFIFYIK